MFTDSAISSGAAELETGRNWIGRRRSILGVKRRSDAFVGMVCSSGLGGGFAGKNSTTECYAPFILLGKRIKSPFVIEQSRPPGCFILMQARRLALAPISSRRRPLYSP